MLESMCTFVCWFDIISLVLAYSMFLLIFFQTAISTKQKQEAQLACIAHLFSTPKYCKGFCYINVALERDHL